MSLLLLLHVGSALASPAPINKPNFICPYREREFVAALAPAFKAQAGEMAVLFGELSDRFGRCLRLEAGEAPGAWRLRFREAAVPVRLRWEGKKIVSLGWGLPEFPGDSWAQLRKRVGGGAIAVRGEGGEIFSERGAELRSVGESAHLLLLAEYRRRLAAGALKAEQVMVLREENKAFSPGPLVNWAAGVPLTLESLAQLAFRSRDEIAGDLLLEALGRKVGLREPVFTYKEMHHLLLLPGAQAEPFLGADGPTRLSGLDAPPGLREPLYQRSQVATQVGWFASAGALCEAAWGLREDPALTEAGADGWEKIGVFPLTLNLTRVAKTAAGWRCVSVTMPGESDRTFSRARELVDRALALAGVMGQHDKEAPKNGR